MRSIQASSRGFLDPPWGRVLVAIGMGVLFFPALFNSNNKTTVKNPEPKPPIKEVIPRTVECHASLIADPKTRYRGQLAVGYSLALQKQMDPPVAELLFTRFEREDSETQVQSGCVLDLGSDDFDTILDANLAIQEHASWRQRFFMTYPREAQVFVGHTYLVIHNGVMAKVQILDVRSKSDPFQFQVEFKSCIDLSGSGLFPPRNETMPTPKD